jgi:hypothetical protein
MNTRQQEYIARANVLLQQPLEVGERIKILKILGQMYTAEAAALEQRLEDLQLG